MNKENRRAFLRQFSLAVGALTVGGGEAAAFLYQKKSGTRRAPAGSAQSGVDHRFAPSAWHSPARYPGKGGQAFIGRMGSLLRPGDGPNAGSVELFLEGSGEPTGFTQRCDQPHIPFVLTSVSYGETAVEMTAFSSDHDDEGTVDNIVVAITPAGASPSLRLVLRAGAPLAAEVEEDDDLPNGGFCFVTLADDDDHAFLIIDARPEISRDGDALVLTVPAPAAGAGTATYTIRVPSARADSGDVADGVERMADRTAAEMDRWTAWKGARGAAGWDLPGAYGEFSVAAARIIDQVSPPAEPQKVETGVANPGARPDLVDEHFISEAELFIGREKEGRRRLEAVWNLEDDRGLLIGAGGPSNSKEMCAAVYSLCRHAELSGDWTMFDELYPDAFNALASLKRERDRLAALPEKSGNVARNLLPEGSPGAGWVGTYAELTNTIWALIALKLMLDISDRRFLMKKSEIREFYGQLLLAMNTTARETTRTDPAGFSWFPVITAAGAGGTGELPPQSGLGTLSLALFPGLIYKKDERMFQGYPALAAATLADGIPAGTGPGGAGGKAIVDAAIVAQTLTWLSLPEEARKMFIGYLNHASPVYTWPPPAHSSAAGPLPIDLRASAESLRFLRHAMILEDDGVLRLFEGIAAADLAAGKPMRIENSPTRWGRVSAALEPVDARTWKATYRREPVNPEMGAPLKSVEMPRVLAPNFRFDTISPGSAVKNGPRVLIDAEPLGWEAYLRDLRR
jgi:hypothetical protein